MTDIADDFFNEAMIQIGMGFAAMREAGLSTEDIRDVASDIIGAISMFTTSDLE
jgi:hypothetical protein